MANKYQYDYFDAAGEPQTWWGDAEDADDALRKVVVQGIADTDGTLTKLAELPAAVPLQLPSEPQQPQSTARLSKQECGDLGTLLAQAVESDLPLAAGLRALADSISSRYTAQQLERLADQIDAGRPLSDAISDSQLPPHITGMIDAGLQSGQLTTVMARFNELEQEDGIIRRAMRQAATYPTVIATVSMIIGLGMSWFIIPQFAAMYNDFDFELPMLTHMLMTASYYTQSPLCTLGPIALILFCVLPKPKFIARLIYLLPVIGPLLHAAEMSQISGRLALMLELKLPMPEALRLTAASLRWPRLRKALSDAATQVEQGVPTSSAITVRPFCAPILRSMLVWGERTSDLPEACRCASETYQQQASELVRVWDQTLSILAGLVVMGVVMLMFFCVIALFQPMITLVTSLSG